MLFQIGRNLDDVTPKGAFYRQIFDQYLPISIQASLQTFSGSISRKNIHVNAQYTKLTTEIKRHKWAGISILSYPIWTRPFAIILGHVNSCFIGKWQYLWMTPVLSCTAARNGLQAAHLHWLKGRWHGAVKNTPNILEAVWHRSGYYGQLTKRYYVACWIVQLPMILCDLQVILKLTRTLPKGRW